MILHFDEVMRECAEPNWDGYNALPASPISLFYAQQLSELLPSDCPKPDIGCDPDGSLNFDWRNGKMRAVSVSAGVNGRMAYAALFDEQSESGTEPIDVLGVNKIVNLVKRCLAIQVSKQ